MRYFTLTVLLYTKKNSRTTNPVVVNYRKFVLGDTIQRTPMSRPLLVTLDDKLLFTGNPMDCFGKILFFESEYGNPSSGPLSGVVRLKLRS